MGFLSQDHVVNYEIIGLCLHPATRRRHQSVVFEDEPGRKISHLARIQQCITLNHIQLVFVHNICQNYHFHMMQPNDLLTVITQESITVTLALVPVGLEKTCTCPFASGTTREQVSPGLGKSTQHHPPLQEYALIWENRETPHLN